MNKIKIFILILISLVNTSAYSDGMRAWTALRVGNKMRSNLDVESYISATRLNVEAKILLFNAANQNYDQYLKLKRELVREQFQTALKELAYSLLLEHDATAPRFGSETERRGFRITERDFDQKIQDNENKNLKEYLDKQLGIVKARELFAQELIKKGYPHQIGQTPTDVYWSWYEYQKDIIREDLRKNAVQQYEYVMATKKYPNLELRPFDISDFKRELDKKIAEKLQNKTLRPNELKNILKSNPELNLRIKNIHQLSLQSIALGKMKSFEAVGEHKLEQAYHLIENNFIKNLSEQTINRILEYEEISKDLSDRYENAQKLHELSSEKMDQFIQGGTYNDLMMSRLYALAAKLKKGVVKREENRNTLAKALDVAFKNLKQAISNKDIEKNDPSLLFEDLVARNLQESLAQNLSNQDYLSDITAMAIWVIKFEAKKVASQDSAIIQIEKKEDNFQSWKELENHLKAQLFKDGLQNYYRHDLRENAYLLEINLNGARRIHSDDAYDFVLKDYLRD